MRFSWKHWWNLVLALEAAAGVVAWRFRLLDGRLALLAVLGWIALGFVVAPSIMYEHLGFLDRHAFHDYYKANLRYRKAIETGKATAQGLCALASLNLAEGDAAGALELLEEAVGKRPDDPYLYVLMSKALSRSGRHQEAIAAALRCHELHGEKPFFATVLGDALKAKGDYQSAAAAYQEALRQDPSLMNCRVSLAEAYLFMGQVDAAEKEITTVLRARPREPDALYWAGRISEAKGDIETARSWLQSALEARPVDDRALTVPYQDVVRAYSAITVQGPDRQS